MATTAAGLRYPLSTDAINIPQDFLNLATDVDTYVVAATTTQNATVTAQLSAQNTSVTNQLTAQNTAVNNTLGGLSGLDIAVIMSAF
jgi:hypothetical protein